MLFIDMVPVSICPRLSSHIFFRSQKKWSSPRFPAVKYRNDTKQADRQKKQAGHAGPCIHQKKKKKQYIRFLNGGSPPFFPQDETACLFLLTGFEVWFSVCVPIMSSVRGKVFPAKFELTMTSEQPSTVVRSISQFERHCCPSVSKPVPADDDSCCPSSGYILASVFPPYKHVHRTIFLNNAIGG